MTSGYAIRIHLLLVPFLDFLARDHVERYDYVPYVMKNCHNICLGNVGHLVYLRTEV